MLLWGTVSITSFNTLLAPGFYRITANITEANGRPPGLADFSTTNTAIILVQAASSDNNVIQTLYLQNGQVWHRTRNNSTTWGAWTRLCNVHIGPTNVALPTSIPGGTVIVIHDP